jgi:serine/threonine protein phosphatase 1
MPDGTVAKGKTIAVGDIHGCSTAQAALMRAISPGPNDTVVTLGDAIDRGPDTREVIEQLLRLAECCQLVPLLGNHEEMLFAALEGRDDLAFWVHFGGDQVLASYGIDHPRWIPRAHLDFLKSWQPFHETESHIFVHANCQPNLPLEQQSWSVLLWEELDLGKASPHCSGKTVVVGHTRQEEDILDLGFLICLDTGSGFGGWLTGLDVDSGHFWQANEQEKVKTGRLSAWKAKKS